jgi:hypothetical protein
MSIHVRTLSVILAGLAFASTSSAQAASKAKASGATKAAPAAEAAPAPEPAPAPEAAPAVEAAPAAEVAPAAEPESAAAPEPSAQPPANAYPPQSYYPGYYPPSYYPGYYPPPSYYPPSGYPPSGYYAPPGYPLARPLGPPPGAHEHDGFYMRLTMGGGYLHASTSQDGMTTSLSGAGLSLNMALGGSVTHNWIVFGEVSVSSASAPVREDTGYPDKTLDNQTLSLISVGPGVAYYFDSLNLYLSGAVTMSMLTLDRDNSNSSQELTRSGFGASFMVGKEWWVSSDWGVGIAGMLQGASMKDKYYDQRWSAGSLSVLFSATYN